MNAQPKNSIPAHVFVEPCEWCDGAGKVGVIQRRPNLLERLMGEESVDEVVRCRCGNGKWLVIRDAQGNFVGQMGIQ
jgi:hypothetical protein